ncbi:hypothetical protein ACFQ8C_01860 [Streptomyces sp. NPDC056503]|uniref:hypothetical protein n=1 Tax=Streptomyces sp. NPDC056503 TaxID=3345842 RepID=UPI0036B897EF
MAWEGWDRPKPSAAEQDPTRMRLNRLPDERASGGGANGDLTMDHQDLVAVGNSAFKLFEGLGNHGRDALKTKGDLMKGLVGVAVGAGAAALAPAGMAGAVISATAGGYFGAVAGIGIDRMTEGQQASGAADRALHSPGHDLSDHLGSVRVQTQESAIDAMELHGSKLPADSIRNEIRDAVNDGRRDSDSALEDVHNRPTA